MFKGGTLTILNLCHWSVFDQIIIGRPDPSATPLVSVAFQWLEWQLSGRVALWWRSGIPVAQIRMKFSQLVEEWSERHSSGGVTLDWIMACFRNSSQGRLIVRLPL